MVAVVGILAGGMVTPARADLEIQLSTDGTTWTPVSQATSGTSAIYSNSAFQGLFDVSMLGADSNSPGTTPPAYLEGSDTHVANISSGIATLYIKLSDTGFTSPLNPPAILLDSQIGTTVTVGGKDNALTYQSYVDPSNGEATLTGFTTGPQMPSITGSPKSSNDDTSKLITSGLTSTYSITEYFKITLDGGSQINFSSGTNLSAVPEPSSLMLTGLGALGLIGYGLRRRGAVSVGDRA
jgi:hypothetical protein